MKKFQLLLRENAYFRLSLSALSGILMAVSWPPSGLNFLLLFALVPLMLVFFNSTTAKSALLNSYLTYAIFSTYTMSWFSLITDDPAALFLIYMAHIFIPLTQSIPWILAFWVNKKKGLLWSLMSLPFFYLSYEIFHYHWDLTYTWLHLGLGLSNSPYLLKLYPFIGQEGGTFYILLVNALIALSLFIRGKRKSRFASLIMIPVLLLLPIILPASKKERSTESLKVAIYQPTTAYDLTITNETIDENYSALENVVQNIDSGEVDLLICPEGYFKNYHNNPIIINNPFRHSVIQKLLKLSKRKGCAIITGVIAVKLYYTDEAPTVSAKFKKEGIFYDTYNAVMLIEPNGQIQWRSKVRLVPFAERVPFLAFFKSLEVLHVDFNQSKGSYDFEHDPSPFTYKNAIIAPLVCYESLYPDVTSLFLDRKANIIMEFSNENWTKEVNKGQIQHENYAKVNAIQFGRDYLRSTFNHGSAVFTPDLSQFEFSNNTADLALTTVNLNSNKTFYTKHRSLWKYVFVISLALIIVTLWSLKYNK